MAVRSEFGGGFAGGVGSEGIGFGNGGGNGGVSGSGSVGKSSVMDEQMQQSLLFENSSVPLFQ
jgi:hypothetical protein